MSRSRVLIFSIVFLVVSTSLASALTISTPDGSVPIAAASAQLIQWTGQIGTKFNVYASYDNKLTWTLLNKTGKLTTTSFNWTVPALTKNKTNCYLRVKGYDDVGAKVEAAISNVFAIDILNVTYPNGPADSLSAGQIRTITWDVVTQAPYDTTILSYTVDGGITYLPIARLTGMTGPGSYSYNWTVPQRPSDTNCRIKVVLKNATTLVAQDSSNTFPIDVTPKTVADASGRYILNWFGVDNIGTPSLIPVVQILDLQMNGNGFFDYATIAALDGSSNSGTNVPYSVLPNGQMTIGDDTRGILSWDNAVAIMADTGKKNGDIGFSMAIKAPTPPLLPDASLLSGTYVVGQCGIAISNGAPWAFLSEVTSDGAGTATIHCIAVSDGVCFPDSVSPYVVNTDGTFQVGGLRGPLSEDGSVFSLVDYDSSDGDISFIVGMKKPSAPVTNATLTGKFVTAGFGLAAGQHPWTNVAKIKFSGKTAADGTGGLTYSELYTAWPPLDTPGTAKYIVQPDGTFTAGDTGTGVQGVVLQNGQGFFFMDLSSGDVQVTVGLKTAK